MNRIALREVITSSSSDDSTSTESSDSSSDVESGLLPIPRFKSGGPGDKPPPSDPAKEQLISEKKHEAMMEDFQPENFYKKAPALIRMSLTRRRIVSGCQWTSNILLYVMGILGLIDILIAPTGNSHYIYLSASEAAAAGFLGFHGSIYSEWVYFVFECVSFGFMCLAFFLELRCYRLRMMGCDLKWDVFPISMIDDQFVIDSIQQARLSFSPMGASYDNYVYFLLFHVMLFILIFFHIFIQSWNILFFAVLFVVLTVWSLVIVTLYMHKTYFLSNEEFRRYTTLKEKFLELVETRKKEIQAIKDEAIREYLRKQQPARPTAPPIQIQTALRQP